MRKTYLLAMIVLASQVFGVDLNAAGATFPEPLYAAMFKQYQTHRVNYQAIGSGSGIKQLIARTVDFAGSDAPLNDDEKAQAKDDVLHIPMALGAIVMAYNLPGNLKLKLDGDTVAKIYLGQITKWNDPAIATLNPGVDLPNLNIVVVYRSDSSGTTYNFTLYLTKVSKDWKKAVGTSKAPKWPVGIGGKGNAGVGAYVKQVPGSIGYVEFAYAKQNALAYALLKNSAGKFIDAANPKSLAAAIVNVPADGIADVVNSPAKEAYPIAATTWILLYKDLSYLKDKNRAKAIVETIWWMVHDGQKIHPTVDYGPISSQAVKVSENLLNSVVFNGKKVR
ncbi:phosphate ABC transporter substrate-binding protein PstS [Thermospira aquatica]|uniref:Phosphate-binding protein n=1 Tax=Thermospira aquatica TaxID=2828656 RepID=A0AAX3BBL1_9SPIR|nr:phosphate ABC transporter substrate-binding protein PstS [Thermospira aquatica]URA09640.1 phosphate ABC transporter substrate-binding protein PstS [Thermospira aquatica]